MLPGVSVWQIISLKDLDLNIVHIEIVMIRLSSTAWYYLPARRQSVRNGLSLNILYIGSIH